MSERTPHGSEALNGLRWRCRSCGEEHEGVFDLGTPAPWHWRGKVEPEPNSALRLDGDFLSDDLCVIGGRDYFVHGILLIPIHGLDRDFGLGCWSTLSQLNFERYAASLDGDDGIAGEAWTGWFSGWFNPFPSSVNEPCWVEPQPDGMRPRIRLESADHPLAVAAREGISVEQLLEIYRANGHAAA